MVGADTAEKHPHAILLVDDEESITKALQRLFRRQGFEIFSAQGGEEGLRVLRDANRPFSVIVSDQRMPGMTGVQFLEAAKTIHPRAIRILLTGYSDVNAIIDAINRGGIHRYMAKPWNDDEILLVVRQALEQYELVRENERLMNLTRSQNAELREWNRTLEQKVEERSREVLIKNEALSRLNAELESNLYNSVRAFASLAERQNTAQAGHMRRVGQVAGEIARMMNLPEAEVVPIEIAALLHDFGKLSFPQRLLEYRDDAWTSDEKKLYRKHPHLGQETVHFISKLDHVGILIRTHHERFDGQGYPDQLREEEIPVGARIIAVADAYDKITKLRVDIDGSVKALRIAEGRLIHEELLQKAAVVHLKKESFLAYDPDVVKVFLNGLKSQGAYREDRKISIEEIAPGMTLSRALYTSGGRFLLPANTVMGENYVKKIRALHETDFIESVYVLRK
jgi:response regulator RpfG family c-di-GMP phosphodiesterase